MSGLEQQAACKTHTKPTAPAPKAAAPTPAKASAPVAQTNAEPAAKGFTVSEGTSFPEDKASPNNDRYNSGFQNSFTRK